MIVFVILINKKRHSPFRETVAVLTKRFAFWLYRAVATMEPSWIERFLEVRVDLIVLFV